MTVLTPAQAKGLPLVDIIDFKWLMAGAGLDVHVERMQADRLYAGECLARGACSRVRLLRDTSQRLADALGIALPPA
ncbi:hypothetical protein [Aquabacterium sp. OR-4]|uniref:hypothetical protein n=1 Tax=Aquabacterium sp. OR-4 TaxID=2978127 RepID=UPI0021B2D1B9|nr:hypothetical protein [Aquabacterium sp. OR-4]MDT7833811.1 hypothetical protein [Aquabacterium sp. OR-4]